MCTVFAAIILVRMYYLNGFKAIGTSECKDYWRAGIKKGVSLGTVV